MTVGYRPVNDDKSCVLFEELNICAGGFFDRLFRVSWQTQNRLDYLVTKVKMSPHSRDDSDQHMCSFEKAANNAGRMVELQSQMNKISPFMGWHPYTVYGCKWEKKRMEKAHAKTHGPDGTLVA